jgi:hypothetical protein
VIPFHEVLSGQNCGETSLDFRATKLQEKSQAAAVRWYSQSMRQKGWAVGPRFGHGSSRRKPPVFQCGFSRQRNIEALFRPFLELMFQFGTQLDYKVDG